MGHHKNFETFADERTCTIISRKLRRAAEELGKTMTDEKLKEMIDCTDLNGDSQLLWMTFTTSGKRRP